MAMLIPKAGLGHKRLALTPASTIEAEHPRLAAFALCVLGKLH